MRNLKKYLIILTVIFPVIILLSSVFAEKSSAGSTCSDKGGYCINVGFGGKCLPEYSRTYTVSCFDPNEACCLPDSLLTPTAVPTIAPPTPTSAPTSTQISCQTAGGSCIPIGPCAPPAQATSLSCESGVCCTVPPPTSTLPTTAPKTPVLKWTLITSCNVQAPAQATTSSCENFTNSAACSGNGCAWQDAPEVDIYGGFCSAPASTPTPTSAPISPTDTPIPTLTPIPTPTPTFCRNKNDCNNPPECRTAELSQCLNPGKESAFCLYAVKAAGASCTLPDKQTGICSNNGVCLVGGATPILTPTLAPGAPTLTPTSIPPGITSVHFKIALSGIVDNPSRPSRKLNIEIFDPQNNNAKIADLTTDVANDPSVKQFKKIHALDENIKPGIYNIKVKTDGYLRRLILSVRITKGVQNDIALATLIPGDINGDNRIDLLDYNLFITCYGTKANLPTCDKTVLKLADFDDNIVIDGIDYNTFIKGLSVKEGD